MGHGGALWPAFIYTHATLCLQESIWSCFMYMYGYFISICCFYSAHACCYYVHAQLSSGGAPPKPHERRNKTVFIMISSDWKSIHFIWANVKQYYFRYIVVSKCFLFLQVQFYMGTNPNGHVLFIFDYWWSTGKCLPVKFHYALPVLNKALNY